MTENRCRLAVMDLGSQTFRMAGAEVEEGRARVLFSKRANVRMGQSLLRNGFFSKEAIKRGIETVANFMKELSSWEIASLRAIATEAFRRASNSNDFLREAKKLGVAIEIISPEEEASLAVKGAYLTLQNSKSPWIMVDSGGGSTEIVLCDKDRVRQCVSLKMGAVSLKEESLQTSLASRKFLRKAALERIVQGLDAFKKQLSGVKTVVATGGTATTIAAVALGLSIYDPRKVRGFVISCQELEELYDRVSDMDLETRKKIKGLEPERADIFPAGIAILLELIRYLGLEKIIISDGGILLGLLTAFMEKECNFYVELSGARGLYV